MPGSSSANLGLGTPQPLMPYPLPASVVNGTMSPQGTQTPSAMASAFSSEGTQAASGQGASAYDSSSMNQAGCSTCGHTFVSDTDHTPKPFPSDPDNPSGCDECQF